MPPKIRELIAEPECCGFTNRGGKGSHRNFNHPKGSQPVRISRRTGDDAKKYQIKQVRAALDEVKKNEKRIGMSPELMYGGDHGNDALKVFVELNETVEEVIQIFKEDGKPLPIPKEVVFETA